MRFVELIDTGTSNNWDSHGDMADHGRLSWNVDRPIAGLLRDLRQRGLLAAWWVGRHPVLGLRRRGRQPRRDGEEIGRNIFAARASHRLTGQPRGESV